MDLRKLKTLIDLVAESGIAELEVTEENDKVRIVNKVQTVAVAAPVAAPVVAAAPAPVAAAIPAAPAAASAPAAPAAEKIIESPLVGTFYRSASPDSAPFVQIGSKVTEDTTVCIIEAMKVMNEVKAEKSGIIKEILVENGSPVEYGMPIFVIE